jgi:hypothetical protein
MKNSLIFKLAALLCHRANTPMQSYLTVSVANGFCIIVHNGKSVLPSGRFVSLEDKTIRIIQAPFGIAISPAGKTAITLQNGLLPLLI